MTDLYSRILLSLIASLLLFQVVERLASTNEVRVVNGIRIIEYPDQVQKVRLPYDESIKVQLCDAYGACANLSSNTIRVGGGTFTEHSLNVEDKRRPCGSLTIEPCYVQVVR